MTLRSRQIIPPIIFAALSLIAYANCLFDESRLPAAPGTDLEMQFISWREFGFGEMLRGNLPLWNPHIFGGTPYMASFQSALFYPINWLHFFLPVSLAITWYCVVHTFLMGYFTSLWAGYRGISIRGQILAGVMAMFSGQYFLHAYAGHLPHLAVMVWAPLIFLCVDALADGRSWKWLFLGSAAIAMQIFAGHPQYVFYGALTIGLYALLRLFFSKHRIRLVAGVAAIYMIGALLSAIQLVPGLDATRENVRVGGLPYEMAAQFSTAPEQWVTALSPFVFGHLHEVIGQTGAADHFYIGYGYLWELCFFVSITGFVLAIVGILATSRANRVVCLILLAILVVISMGRFTPLHRLLYDYLPGFGSFRVPAKFMFFGTLIVAILAAEGLDAVRSAASALHLRRAAIIAAEILAFFLIIEILLLAGDGLWSWEMQRLANAPERFNAYLFADPDFIAAALRIARYAIA
ncbi:MAG TPA: hypothetical protein VHP11_07100, partial [Tepidisphaeraceae bacterium]|nr:hypothetical protein [Tepidisphaeraceae bacterium]